MSQISECTEADVFILVLSKPITSYRYFKKCVFGAAECIRDITQQAAAAHWQTNKSPQFGQKPSSSSLSSLFLFTSTVHHISIMGCGSAASVV